MEKYDVSYQQVYTWVRKYQQNGEQGLVDRRGRGKYIDESIKLTAIERYQLRIKKLGTKYNQKRIRRIMRNQVYIL